MLFTHMSKGIFRLRSKTSDARIPDIFMMSKFEGAVTTKDILRSFVKTGFQLVMRCGTVIGVYADTPPSNLQKNKITSPGIITHRLLTMSVSSTGCVGIICRSNYYQKCFTKVKESVYADMSGDIVLHPCISQAPVPE